MSIEQLFCVRSAIAQANSSVEGLLYDIADLSVAG
jgi:hypothetical protein